jgi:hypothetical protein
MIYPPPLSVPTVAEESPADADAEESPADADAEESDVKFLLKSLNASTAKSLIFSDCVLVSW